MSEIYLLCGHRPDTDVICRQCHEAELARLKRENELLSIGLTNAKVERVKREAEIERLKHIEEAATDLASCGVWDYCVKCKTNHRSDVLDALFEPKEEAKCYKCQSGWCQEHGIDDSVGKAAK